MEEEIDGWKPIETAPRDGRAIQLGWYRESCVYGLTWEREVGRWKRRLFGRSGWVTGYDNPTERPTHWDYLPPPPKKDETKKVSPDGL
jgi:hypothetical protein